VLGDLENMNVNEYNDFMYQLNGDSWVDFPPGYYQLEMRRSWSNNTFPSYVMYYQDVYCSSYSNCTYLNFSPSNHNLEINNIEFNPLSIKPNPATNIITVSYNPKSPLKSVGIYNMIGTQVILASINNNITKTTNIDVSQLGTGVYFVKAIDQNEIIYMQKFIKK
jgi:hypothetical protein